MNLKVLYEKIESQITQRPQIVLSQASTGVSEISQFCDVFKLQEISLVNAACTLEEELLTLTGSFDIKLPDTGEVRYNNLRLTMTVDSAGEIECSVVLPTVKMTTDGLLCLGGGILEISMAEGKDIFSETLNGNMVLDNNKFHLCSERKSAAESRKFKICSDGPLDILSFLEMFLKLMDSGLDISVFHFDQNGQFHLKEFDFSYMAPDSFLTALSDEAERFGAYLGVSMKTDLGFYIGGSFGVENTSFSMEKYGQMYLFAVDADLQLFGVVIPFRISYASNCFRLWATEADNVQLQSVEDMGSLVGVTGILGNFPLSFMPTDSIRLHTLNMLFSSDLKKMLDFQIVAELDYRWQLCAAPDITVSEIMISFGYSPSLRQFGMKGNISFCDVDTQLAAVVTVGDSRESRWSFSWRMYDNESVSLNRLVQGLAETFGMQTQIKMPEIEVAHVEVTYCDNCFSIGAMVTLSNSRLFSSAMDMRFAYTAEKDSKDFRASFCWKSRDNSLNIGNILKECGAEDGLEAIPGFIREIGVSEVKLDYAFAENKLVVEVDVEEVGKLAFELHFGDKCQYAVAVQFALEAGFDNLPVVGNLSPALKETKLGNILLVAASCDMKRVTFFGQDMTVKQGVILSSKLSMPQKVIPLELQLEDGGTNLREETVQNVFLPAAAGSSSNAEKVIPINKAIGPLQMDSIQMGYRDGRLSFGITAGFQSGALYFAMEGLSIQCGLSDKSVSFGLNGLSVGLSTDAVTVNGGFLNSGDGNYAGTLMLAAGSLSLTAVGTYTEKPFRSFFVFASIKGNVGGPPCFYVTGIAAGFGYQRELAVPEIQQLEQFPLLQAVDGKLSREALLTNTDTYFPRAEGQIWIAAGVLFNTFKMADSAAILSVSLGNETEITLTGRSLLNVPFDEKDAPVAHGVLLLKAAIRPAAGLIAVEAALGEDSYVLCKDCHITGGFAFYTWYSGEHSGDFVLTLGGYHPSYQKPAHYPDVKRLGLSWKISDSLSAEGDIYFALTPSVLMAGGGMKFLYTSSCVDAWLEARINALIRWKPYHYDFYAGISAGVRVHIAFIRFSLELGCDLHVWGPEFSGQVHIKLWCLSFTVRFGAGSSDPAETISAEEFKSSFLEDGQEETAGKFRISLTDGVIKEYETETGEKEWIVAPEQLQLILQSGIPVMDAEFTTDPSSNKRRQLYSGGNDVYVRPCGAYMKQSKLTAKILCVGTDETVAPTNDRFMVEEFYEKMPAALWGEADDKKELIEHCTGIRIWVKSDEPKLLMFSHQSVNMAQDKALEKAPDLAKTQYEQDQTYTYLSHAADEKVAEERQELFAGLGGAYEKTDVADWAARAAELFCERPMAASIGGVSV